MKIGCKNDMILGSISLALIITAFLILYPQAIPQAMANNMDSGKSYQHEKWWKDDQIVKDAIISYLMVRDRCPDECGDANMYNDIMFLLLLFDSMETKENMKNLVDLGSYYIGAAGGEIYSCLIIRKGASIVSVINDTINKGKNECIETLGSSKTDICLDKKTYNNRLKELLKRIKENEPCSIER